MGDLSGLQNIPRYIKEYEKIAKIQSANAHFEAELEEFQQQAGNLVTAEMVINSDRSRV